MIKAPVVEQELPEAAALDAFEELFGNDLIRIDVDAVKRRYQPGVSFEWFHKLLVSGSQFLVAGFKSSASVLVFGFQFVFLVLSIWSRSLVFA